ncbi:hypothetical protein SSCG_04275 [Streptomyces clavuligerus]|nr:hypothetical protein SSCG_04275 [Streptomyces clavuligerus]
MTVAAVSVAVADGRLRPRERHAETTHRHGCDRAGRHADQVRQIPLPGAHIPDGERQV